MFSHSCSIWLRFGLSLCFYLIMSQLFSVINRPGQAARFSTCALWLRSRAVLHLEKWFDIFLFELFECCFRIYILWSINGTFTYVQVTHDITTKAPSAFIHQNRELFFTFPHSVINELRRPCQCVVVFFIFSQ